MLILFVGTLICGAIWLHRRRNNKKVIAALNSRPSSHENPMYGVPARRFDVSFKLDKVAVESQNENPMDAGRVEAAVPQYAEAMLRATHANPMYLAAPLPIAEATRANQMYEYDSVGADAVVYSVPTAEGGSLYATVTGANSAHAMEFPNTVMSATVPAEEGVANGVTMAPCTKFLAPYDTVMSFAIPTEDGGSIVYSTAEDAAVSSAISTDEVPAHHMCAPLERMPTPDESDGYLQVGNTSPAIYH